MQTRHIYVTGVRSVRPVKTHIILVAGLRKMYMTLVAGLSKFMRRQASKPIFERGSFIPKTLEKIWPDELANAYLQA
jgi:hypothetical protein